MRTNDKRPTSDLSEEVPATTVANVQGLTTEPLSSPKNKYKDKNMKHTLAKLKATKLSEVSQSDIYSVVKHTETKGSSKFEIKGPKYPDARRQRHAIFKDGKLHSISGTLSDAKGRLNVLETKIKQSIQEKISS